MDPVDTFRALTDRADADIHVPAAALALAAVHYQGLDVEASLAELADLRDGARSRTAGLAARERLAATCAYFSEDLNFRGNSDDYYAIENNFLNHALERRRGLPIVLAVAFIEIARGAELEIEPVGFPSHFLVRAAAGGQLIDVFDGCRFVGENDCRAILRRAGVPAAAPTRQMLAATPARAVLERMINNIARGYAAGADRDRLAVLAAMRRALTEPAAGDGASPLN